MIRFTILSYLYTGLDIKHVKDGLIKLKTDPKQGRDSLFQQWIQKKKNWLHK